MFHEYSCCYLFPKRTLWFSNEDVKDLCSKMPCCIVVSTLTETSEKDSCSNLRIGGLGTDYPLTHASSSKWGSWIWKDYQGHVLGNMALNVECWNKLRFSLLSFSQILLSILLFKFNLRNVSYFISCSYISILSNNISTPFYLSWIDVYSHMGLHAFLWKSYLASA